MTYEPLGPGTNPRDLDDILARIDELEAQVKHLSDQLARIIRNNRGK